MCILNSHKITSSKVRLSQTSRARYHHHTQCEIVSLQFIRFIFDLLGTIIKPVCQIWLTSSSHSYSLLTKCSAINFWERQNTNFQYFENENHILFWLHTLESKSNLRCLKEPWLQMFKKILIQHHFTQTLDVTQHHFMAL